MRGMITLIFIFGSTATMAAEYLPLNSNATGKEMARAYRADGSMPSRERANADKQACIRNPNELSEAAGAKVQELLKTNREAAEIELIRATAACMVKKGWRLQFN